MQTRIDISAEVERLVETTCQELRGMCGDDIPPDVLWGALVAKRERLRLVFDAALDRLAPLPKGALDDDELDALARGKVPPPKGT